MDEPKVRMDFGTGCPQQKDKNFLLLLWLNSLKSYTNVKMMKDFTAPLQNEMVSISITVVSKEKHLVRGLSPQKGGNGHNYSPLACRNLITPRISDFDHFLEEVTMSLPPPFLVGSTNFATAICKSKASVSRLQNEKWKLTF